jgi:putative ABC transport system permease protein
MSAFGQDLRYGARQLRRSPAFTAVAVLTLALGVGAVTAIFSVVDAVLLRPLPVPEPEGLLVLAERNATGTLGVSPGNFLDWQARNRTLEGLAAFAAGSYVVGEAGEPERVAGAAVTGDFFALLRARPALGRLFAPEEVRPGGEPVVVLGHGLWQRRFGGRPEVVGSSVRLDGTPRTVVGILPDGFAFPDAASEAWIPLLLDPDRTRRGGRTLDAIARLGPGATVEQARADLDSVARGLEAEFPEYAAGWRVQATPIHEQVVGQVRRPLWLLLGAVVLVLLIACANVANLLLARASGRRRELAVRTALGASRARLVTQLLTECALLALLAGALGALLASAGTRALAIWAAGILPRTTEIGVDARVLGFALGVSALTALLCGLLPSLRAARSGGAPELAEGARGVVGARAQRRLLSSLVIGDVALALVLVLGAALLLRSFQHLLAVDPGFRPENLLTFRVALPATRYAEASAVTAFYERAGERLRALPSVEAVGTIHTVPIGGFGSVRPFRLAGQPVPPPGQETTAQYRLVSPDYFAAMGIPLVAGRRFDARDRADAPLAVIVNQEFARRFLVGTEPVGTGVTFGGYEDLWAEVVGVVGDVRQFDLRQAAVPEMYWPEAQVAKTASPTLANHRRGMTFVLRTRGEPGPLADAARRAVLAADPEQPVFALRSMADVLSTSLARARLTLRLFSLFAGVALLLALVGLYALLAYAVSERRHEIGVRLALGAQGRDIFRLIVGEGMRLVVVGATLGLAAALATTRLLAGLLFGVAPTDPATFAAVALLLAATGLLAASLPARHAAAVDPLVALRRD